MNSLTKAAIGLTAAGAAYVLVQKRKHAVSGEDTNRVDIHGFVSSGYELDSRSEVPTRLAFPEQAVRSASPIRKPKSHTHMSQIGKV